MVGGLALPDIKADHKATELQQCDIVDQWIE